MEPASEPIKARGVVVRSPGAPARVEEIVVEPPGPGEVRLRVLASGVCHTDLHARQGNFAPTFPMLLGHEAAGVVEAVGPGVTSPKVGTRVVVTFRAPCGECRLCLGGRQTHCLTPLLAGPRMRTADGLPLGRVLGVGAFATHIVVAAEQAIPIGADLSPEAVCLIGCGVATGVGAVLNVALVERGSTVAVFGCGAVGISVIQGARLAHAGRIIAVDLSQRKLEWARALGATDAVDASRVDPVKRIRELTDGQGVQFAFEAVGLPATVTQALAVCDVGAPCTVIGVPVPKTDVTFSLVRFFYTRGELKTTFGGDWIPARDYPMLANLYRQGALDLDGLITRRIGLDEVEAALGALERGEVLRSVVTFPRDGESS